MLFYIMWTFFLLILFTNIFIIMPCCKKGKCCKNCKKCCKKGCDC
ncbi:hypothetical protein Mgra_00006041, partial [Meloidogyne graminicola]